MSAQEQEAKRYVLAWMHGLPAHATMDEIRDAQDAAILNELKIKFNLPMHATFANVQPFAADRRTLEDGMVKRYSTMDAILGGSDGMAWTQDWKNAQSTR